MAQALLSTNYPTFQPRRIDSITSASSGIAATETVVVGSGKSIPSGFWQYNPQYPPTVKFVLCGTCTATVARTPTFTVRVGTAGTTADTSVAALAGATSASSGSTIPFTAIITVQPTLYTINPAGTVTTTSWRGDLTLINQGTTGIATSVTQVVSATTANSTAIDPLVALFVTVTYKSSGANCTCTFQVAYSEYL